MDIPAAPRVFKTAQFNKAVKRAHVSDAELCVAVKQAMIGQADDLGGGVYKKRLDNNARRSIILAKSGRIWVYQYLFSKNDRANITDVELFELRKLARIYAEMTEQQIANRVMSKEFVEICNGN